MTTPDQLDALAAAAQEAEREAIENFSGDAVFNAGQAADELRNACDPATIRELVAAARERDELREAAGRYIDAAVACRAAADRAVKEKGAAVAFDAGYDQLDVTLEEFTEAETALRAALHREDGA